MRIYDQGRRGQTLKLPSEERFELAQILWKSIEPENEVGFLSVPDWQRKTLEERLADLERNPDDEESWEQVKADLWPGA